MQTAVFFPAKFSLWFRRIFLLRALSSMFTIAVTRAIAGKIIPRLNLFRDCSLRASGKSPRETIRGKRSSCVYCPGSISASFHLKLHVSSRLHALTFVGNRAFREKSRSRVLRLMTGFLDPREDSTANPRIFLQARAQTSRPPQRSPGQMFCLPLLDPDVPRRARVCTLQSDSRTSSSRISCYRPVIAYGALGEGDSCVIRFLHETWYGSWFSGKNLLPRLKVTLTYAEEQRKYQLSTYMRLLSQMIGRVRNWNVY